MKLELIQVPRLYIRVKGDGGKAPVANRPAEVRFNGENLRGVFHHFKAWLHEVGRSGGLCG